MLVAGAERRRRRVVGRVSLVRASEPEVGQPHICRPRPVAGDEDVGRLEVTVHDPAGVSRREPLAGGDEHTHDVAPVPGRVQPPGESASLDQLGHHVDPRVAQTDVVDGDHVGMRQLGERHRFAQQSQAQRLVALPVGPQQLDRDPAVELGIAGDVDHALPPAGELFQDPIPADALLAGGPPEQAPLDFGQQALPLQGLGRGDLREEIPERVRGRGPVRSSGPVASS